MKRVNKLLTLSTFGVLCLVSCGQERYSHNALNCDISIYSADLNHDGQIAKYQDEEGKWHEETGLTWKQSYDVLMGEISDNEKLQKAADEMGIAPIEVEPERASLARYEIMHQAEEMLMDTGAVMPLYNYSDPYLLKPNVSGIYFMNLGTKYLDQLIKNGQSGETFHLSVGTKADTLDPADNNDSSTSNTLNNCMRGLSYYKKNDEEVSGQSRTFGSTLIWNDKLLAPNQEGKREPDVSRDESGIPTYTFTLEKGNKQWSDGSDVKAIDFVYTWHRACSTYHGTWGFVFDCIQGYDDYALIPDPDKPGKFKPRPQEEQQFWETDDRGTEHISGIEIIGEDKLNSYQFKVKLTYDCSFFKELCSFTAYAPLKKTKMDDGGIDQRGKKVDVSTWFNKASNWVTNGPFKIVGINNKQTGTFDIERNDDNGCKAGDSYDTKPQKIYYHLIDDDSAMYMDYQRNRYDMIDSFPTAMTDKIKRDLSNEYRVADQVGNYYFFFNVNDNALDITNNESEDNKERRRAKLRKGLIRLVNRLDMVDTIVKSGATDANGFVSKDITESCIPVWDSGKNAYVAKREDGKLVEADWHTRNKDTFSEWKSSDPEKGLKSVWLDKRTQGGFWKSTEDEDVKEIPVKESMKRQNKIMENNVEVGLNYLKDAIKGTKVTYDERTGKFKNFPTLTITTNTGTGHESLCERLQYLYGLYGITLKIETQEWTAFSSYIREGNVAMARNGWIADFSDARTYLELFTSTSSSNYCQFGKTAEKGAYIHKSQ